MIGKLVGSAGFLSSGGTIGGDLTISGDLTVSGSTTNTYDETVVGQVVVGTTLGSASVPSLGFGDANTGFYESADNVLNTSIAGTVRMVLDGNSRISLSNNTGFDGGTSNTVFGKSVGTIDSGSNYNTFIGEQVAGENTLNDATQNTMVGYRAGYSLTSGASNTIMGRQAGLEIEDGHNNTLIGMNAGANTVLGGYLTAIGDAAMAGVVTATADGAVAIGASALAALTSGAKNIAIGYDSMGDVTSATNNVVIGYEAFNAAANDEADNIAIGVDAMGSVKQGADAAGGRIAKNNVAIGTDALKGSTLESGLDLIGNVAIGFHAMDSTVGKAQTGTIAIGNNALTALTTGANNVAVGYTALQGNITGGANVAIGYGALKGTAGATASASSHNIAIGFDALGGDWNDAATSGYNIAIGGESMDAVMNAAQGNVAMGYGTMTGLLSGNYNVSLGHVAGDAITTGGNNTILGAYADPDANSATNQIVIGHYAVGNGDYSSTVGRHLVSKSRRMLIELAHSGVDSIISEVFKIPALSIIKSVSCVVVEKSSNVNPYTLNLQLSTETGTAADGALVNGSTTITVPEILGAGASATYSQNSATVMGTAADIVAGSGGVDGTTYLNRPNTTIVGTADTYLYICNAVDNGTSASAIVKLDIVVEYVGLD